MKNSSKKNSKKIEKPEKSEKLVKSEKTKKVNLSLYADDHPETSSKGTGFKDKQKALDTLEIIKNRDLTYQKQVVLTMYNRAKHHPHQTTTMKDAMEVFKIWLEKHKK
jgi:hypothetical protein